MRRSPAHRPVRASGRPRRSAESVHGVFQRVAAEIPERVAVVSDEGYFRYGDLELASRRVARRLHDADIGPGDRVGLFALRSAEAIAAMLGIFRSGAICVPFDWNNPAAVQRRIYQDAAPKAMLAQESLCRLATQFWDGQAMLLDLRPQAEIGEPPAVETAPHDLACVLYGRGAAGMPSVVPLTHRALLRFALNCSYAELGADEVILQLADLSADIAGFEIWGALLNGGQLAIPAPGDLSIEQIAAAVGRHGVTTLWLPARLAANAIELSPDRVPPLRQLLAGGDVLAPIHVQKALLKQVEAVHDGAANALPEPALASAPLTDGQAEIWLASQLGDEASCACNECLLLHLQGRLDPLALRQALRQLLERHEALRVAFGASGEAMRIAPPWPLELDSEDCMASGDGDAEAALARELQAQACMPFDLTAGPPIRVRLLRLRPDRHVLLLSLHRIVCDGGSLPILLSELSAIYAANSAGCSASLPEAPSFSAYAKAQGYVAAEAAIDAETYWMERFTPLPPSRALPADRPRPAARSFSGAVCRRRLDAARRDELLALAGRCAADLRACLLAAWQALIGRLTASDDVVVGVPVDGRTAPAESALVGHCENLLPLRAGWTGATGVAEHIAAVSHSLAEAREHRRCSLTALSRKLPLLHDQERAPLTQVLFRLEQLPGRIELPGLQVELERAAKVRVCFDLCLTAVDAGDVLELDCEYNSDLFEAATIERWLDCYLALLQGFVDDDRQPLTQVSCLPRQERNRLLFSLNATASAYPRELTLHRLFEARAAERPAAVAAQFGAARLSYGELDRRANRLAHHLRERVGEAPQRLGILLRRSLDMLVAMLACLKAGHAYVPLDPAHPRARLRQVLEQAGVAALICHDGDAAAVGAEGLPLISPLAQWAAIASAPATPPDAHCGGDSLAYVIFTSGSTGIPKGVEICHRAVVNLLLSMAREPGFDEDDVLLATTTISFDIAALELFLPLLAGGRVVIASRREAANGEALLRRLQRSRATLMQATPSTWKMLLEAGFRGSGMRRMLCGGEALPLDLARRLLADGGELWNMYGPTETTVWSSCARVACDRPINVGRMPIANTRFYILDHHDQPLPVGVPGQLHIAGDGLARGYLGQAERTAESFVADPFNGGRMYRTGDLAQRLPGGEVQLLGRMDRQLKLRGFRIEPDEIESVLLKGGRVTSAAVDCRTDASGVARLVAYYVEAPGGSGSPAELRAALAAELPDYMIPAVWVRLEQLPLTPNGKVDRKALPAPAAPPEREEYVGPASAEESALAAIWIEVLKLERVDVRSDIFDLGADSIQLFQITARARRDGLPVSARLLMKHRTVARLAAALRPAMAGGQAQPEGATGETSAIRSSV